MSTPTPQNQPNGQAPQAPQPTAEAHAAVPHGQAAGRPARKLSTFLKVSIILLAVLSVASIGLLFIGDFEGRFERVFSTFVLFAVFVGLTALDTRRDLKSDWYAPVALIANAYILGLLLIVIWISDYDRYWLVWDIFWKSVVVIGVTRAVLGCCQLLLGLGRGRPETLNRFAFITSVFAVLSGILFTAPIAIDSFGVVVPELYWKIAVATLILTALGLAITLLLRWSYSAGDREAARVARAAQAEAYAAAQAQQAMQAQPQPFAGQPGALPAPPAPPAAPVAPQPNAQGLLPWPTFPDGRPLPMGPDGQPDFSVLNGR
ncbi:hypothetical protein [Leucobacter iarius]|uniref:Uncharacterized protein n=1 Tax=Leucobacter iarius TaxID=333963 RepID=A0ABN2LQ68_9MICO